MPETLDQNTQETSKKQNETKQMTAAEITKMMNQSLRKQIYDWIITEPYRDLLSYVQSRVMGQEEIASVVANVYNYLRRTVGVSKQKKELFMTRNNNNNMLLCAPSGSGKTETYRALKDYFADNIPLLIVDIVDVSNITPTGFRGAEPNSIVESFAVCGTDAIGIVFMDEFDKICTPSYTAEHSDIHLSTQHNLLTIIEGALVETKRGYVDTSNLLFIGAGSFDSFRKKRELENKTEIGFGKIENNGMKHSEPVKRENMITAGGSYELIGRFPYIVNYHELDRETVLRIIERDRELIGEDFDCEVILDNNVIDRLCEQANTEFGCRLIDSMLRDPVLRAYGEAMQSGVYGEILTVRLNSLDSYSYEFRESESEKAEQPVMEVVFNEGIDTVALEQTMRMNFEELLTTILGKKKN